MSDPRRVVVAANWKMHKLRADALEYIHDLSTWIDDTMSDGEPGLEVVVAPPFTTLELAVEAKAPFSIFAQNMHQADQGAYTGEVSAPMLKDMSIEGVLLGHSERRQYFGETDEALAEKVHSAIGFGLAPMLCVGETNDQRKAGKAEEVVRGQLETALAEYPAEALPLLYVAYEPVWAIGTGETATPDIAQQMHAEIRLILAEMFGGDEAGRISVLYGGSVKPDNALELLSCPDIDGALVGGAALEVDSFSRIIEAGREVAKLRHGVTA